MNIRVLQRFIEGKQSHDNAVLTAITVCLLMYRLGPEIALNLLVQALNVVIRMQPSMTYPFNVRSFFTDRERKDIGSGKPSFLTRTRTADTNSLFPPIGLELWRGYFQSVRPGINQMLINVDISTATMYKPGSLMKLCLEFLGKDNPDVLAPSRGLPDRERQRLQRFISGIRVLTPTPGGKTIARVIKKLSSAGASALSFQLKEGGSMTVAQYFASAGRALKFPHVLCVEVCFFGVLLFNF